MVFFKTLSQEMLIDQQLKLTTFVVTQEYAGQRLDRFLRKRYKYRNVSLASIYRWIRTGHVRVNGKKAKENGKIHVNDEILLPELSQFEVKKIPKRGEEKSREIDPAVIEKMILFEDENWLVWNKPPHIVIHANVHTGSDWTMHEIMMKYVGKDFGKGKRGESQFLEKNKGDFLSLPSFCFRLDRDTSGILIAAKTLPALQHLNKLIRERKVQKEYLAIVSGSFPPHKSISLSLTKIVDKKFSRGKMVVDPTGKPSFSEAWCVKTREDEFLGEVSLVRVKITTGRMHQIRVHLSHIGYPIIGDLVYGNPVLNRKLAKKHGIKRHLLHCFTYEFVGIDGEKRSFTAPLPEDMERIVKNVFFPGEKLLVEKL